jgi:hypothetical protein
MEFIFTLIRLFCRCKKPGNQNGTCLNKTTLPAATEAVTAGGAMA